ncbi:hypothetical protein E2C01_048214 [Portunus trituberculatus]|uniref:Uncharacterized protein n=1 Tax=Portunus trituberculatus TaxID=210409 RepID=A0A5B7GCN9_PORTR|nr:hypothetical protein [Portunus trituberculatus]
MAACLRLLRHSARCLRAVIASIHTAARKAVIRLKTLQFPHELATAQPLPVNLHTPSTVLARMSSSSSNFWKCYGRNNQSFERSSGSVSVAMRSPHLRLYASPPATLL